MTTYEIVCQIKPEHGLSYQWQIVMCTQEGRYTIAHGQGASVASAHILAERQAKKLGLI